MKTLIIDGANFFHRARAGFTEGPHAVVFNFFRHLRALVGMHKPTRVYFVLEGVPRQRNAMMPEYKANRVIDESDPKNDAKVAALVSFFKQKEVALSLLVKHIPVSVVRHPDFECDDVIYNLIKRSTSACEFIVCSNDSDFTQLLNEFQNVKVYNPMKKTFVETPPYDYVSWKALRGDASDNIPGIPGIGDKTATKLVNDPVALGELFKDEAKAKRFQFNHDMIKFHTWTDAESIEMECNRPTRDWSAVAQEFNRMGFRSITKESTFDKFKATFEPLWGT